MVEYNEDFQQYLETLEDDVEDLSLTIMNIMNITFESEKEFEQAKKIFINDIKQSSFKLITLLERSRIFNEDLKDLDDSM